MSNIPKPPRPGEHRSHARSEGEERTEWVGPEDRREDVTGISDRKLILRAVHEALCTRQDVLLWIQQHGRLENRMTAVERRVDALEGKKTPPSGSFRDPEESFHDFDPEIRKLRADLVGKVKNPHHPISEASALRLMRAEAERIKDATELGTWRSIKRWGASAVGKTFERLLLAAAGGGVGWLVHHFLSH